MDRATAAAAVLEPDAGGELAGRWAAEPAWRLDQLGPLPGRPGDMCPECGGPLFWEAGRTRTFCPECREVELPAAVAIHYERQEQRRAAVATRTAPDAAAVRAARVRLRALQQRAIERVEGFIDAFDAEELTGPVERLALDYQAGLTAYLPEIKSAETEADLAEIMSEIRAVLDQAESSGVLEAIERHREAIERQGELAERQAQLAAQAEREAAQERREAQRRAEIETRAQQRALEAPAPRRPAVSSASRNGYVDGLTMVAVMIEQKRRVKERRLAEHGPCGYQHRKPVIPERRYWLTTLDWGGNQSGHELPNSPAVVVCAKHFAAADTWIEEQAVLFARQRNVHVQAVYTELQ